MLPLHLSSAVAHCSLMYISHIVPMIKYCIWSGLSTLGTVVVLYMSVTNLTATYLIYESKVQLYKVPNGIPNVCTVESRDYAPLCAC